MIMATTTMTVNDCRDNNNESMCQLQAVLPVQWWWSIYCVHVTKMEWLEVKCILNVLVL